MSVSSRNMYLEKFTETKMVANYTSALKSVIEK
jgi:hypothetical protein